MEEEEDEWLFYDGITGVGTTDICYHRQSSYCPALLLYQAGDEDQRKAFYKSVNDNFEDYEEDIFASFSDMNNLNTFITFGIVTTSLKDKCFFEDENRQSSVVKKYHLLWLTGF